MRTENDVAKEQVNLVEVIDKELELFSRQIEEKGILLSFENQAGEVILCANRFSMEQLFNNLLGNAVRYTGEGGRIAVSLHPVEDRHGEIHVESEVNKGTTFVFALGKSRPCPKAKVELHLENTS